MCVYIYMRLASLGPGAEPVDADEVEEPVPGGGGAIGVGVAEGGGDVAARNLEVDGEHEGHDGGTIATGDLEVDSEEEGLEGSIVGMGTAEGSSDVTAKDLEVDGVGAVEGVAPPCHWPRLAPLPYPP